MQKARQGDTAGAAAAAATWNRPTKHKHRYYSNTARRSPLPAMHCQRPTKSFAAGAKDRALS
jgi:hypothetical protein